MLNSRRLGLGQLAAGLVALGAGTIAFGGAARADVVIINGRISIGVGQPAPRYVYPHAYPRSGFDRPTQVFTGRIEDSTLINPVIIGAPIENSTLINPVLVTPPASGRVIVSPGYGRGQDNPACTAFRSLRPACQ